jgi:hypothetical protein
MNEQRGGGDGFTVHESADWQIYSDAYDPGFGSSATFEIDASGTTERAEADDGPVTPGPCGPTPLCFIDGRLRSELGLWAENAATGDRVPGLAGAFAVGAVVMPPGHAARYEGIRIGRLAIWGGGRTGDIVSPNGHRWVSMATTTDDPAHLYTSLLDRMRLAEGTLALEAARAGWIVVLDGPLNRIRSLDQLVAGYVKSHHSKLLPDDAHAAVPRLSVGARTPIYTAGTDRYTCYTRVGDAMRGQSPWSGIARLEFPAVAGIAAVIERADLLTYLLPRYAGAPHRDPRAPVNLTPVKNLESHLSHLLGPIEFATRAARDGLVLGSSAA